MNNQDEPTIMYGTTEPPPPKFSLEIDWCYINQDYLKGPRGTRVNGSSSDLPQKSDVVSI